MDARSPRYQQAQEEEKYLCRMKKHMPEKYRDMCNMHLAFILNLSDDKLEAILDAQCNRTGGKRKLTLAPIFRKKAKTGSCLFGSPLSNESVCLMTPLIKFLTQKENISKEGLFRKPGNRQRMRNLRESLIAKGPSAEIDTGVYNAYDVAGVLKEFLRDLPEPLLSDKHMEAHKQINDLGKHARSSEDYARSLTKKISALQLLMQLLPIPFSRMTKQLLTLLNAVSKTAITKMTPSTLATIFAPIFFLDRKVSALDVCDAVKEVEPALTFMIENAEKMFKVPKELAVDVINYWKEMETTTNDNNKTCDSNGKLSQSYKIRKSISGRTLNTAVCYLDREQCKTVDVASHTQTELENLFAHVQSLPDTPANQRIKDLMARRSRTPLSSGGRSKHSRSKSIGASIRKMVPSLNKSKAKSLDMSVQSQATPYSDKGLRSKSHSQTLTRCKVMVVDCFSPHQVDSKKSSNGKHSTTNKSVISDLMKSSAVSSMTTTIAQSISLHTTPHKSSTRDSPTRSPLNTTIPTELETPVTRKRVNIEKQSIIDYCTPPKQECRNPGSTRIASSCDKNCSQSSTHSFSKTISSLSFEGSFNTSSDTIILDSPVTPMRNHNSSAKLKRSLRSTSLPSLLPVATPREIKEELNSPTVPAVESENEISYMPLTHLNKSTVKSVSSCESPFSSPLARRPLRPCNVPGTPIMPRAMLQIPRYTFETSL